MKRALLLIGEGPELPTSCGAPMPQTMVSVSIEFDRKAFAWRAFDELGNEAHADEGVLAILRCFEKRLAFPREETISSVDMDKASGLALRGLGKLAGIEP